MKINGGYYLKSRCTKNSVVAHAPPHFREIWDWLLANANHKDAKYRGFEVKRGQLFTSYREIRQGLHWYVGWRKMMYNENSAKKGMKFLRENHMITTQKEPVGILVTICNYERYQNPKNYEGTKERTKERTSSELHANQSGLSINKNGNEGEEEKEEITSAESEQLKKGCQEVVDHMNAKWGAEYRKPHKSLVARVREHGVEACKAAIDNTTDIWQKDEKMRQFLRPSTIFGKEKFEGYVNLPKKKYEWEK